MDGVAPEPGVPGRWTLAPVEAPGVSARVPAPAGLLFGATGRELPDEERGSAAWTLATAHGTANNVTATTMRSVVLIGCVFVVLSADFFM
jgi:hypothetical protein